MASKRMLIDATHPEETRVVVLNGNRVDEFDFETASRKPLKGNIYLARVTRVEPSLQAAFVEYGGNRHGFLAFSEIHTDYWQIPIADRQALMEAEAAAAAEEEAEEDEEDEAAETGASAEASDEVEDAAVMPVAFEQGDSSSNDIPDPAPAAMAESFTPPRLADEAASAIAESVPAPPEEPPVPSDTPVGDAALLSPRPEASGTAEVEDEGDVRSHVEQVETFATVETIGGDVPSLYAGEVSGEPEAIPLDGQVIAPSDRGEEDEEDEEERKPRDRQRRRRFPIRPYKIQEVIKRRQILLVQVVKEERGNKGAALTTYLSLAGRYCVLMPNTSRGGGISRKIVSPTDRKRLKALVRELDVPQGMGVILRTAGLDRSKPEIGRDFEYLLRLWDSIRELTLQSTAPCLIYEEGDLIRRSIRDYYASDIEEILVDGEAGHASARDFMRMLMPSHESRVKQHRDRVSLFQRYKVDQQVDAMYSPVVTLRSGGYIVINPTEALVAIDVNSGRSTREHNIEETAYKTNLEAAEEVARQLRLRDLAGLIVVDFIDMGDPRNNRHVERRLKECLKSDRARIQVGRISPFGLLEMSRQRLRPSLIESSTQVCPHCQGRGYVRSTDSSALQVMRAIEEEAGRERAAEINVKVATAIALYIFNRKRAVLADIEERYGVVITIEGDDSLIPPEHRIERQKAKVVSPIAEGARPVDSDALRLPEVVEASPEVGEDGEAETGGPVETARNAVDNESEADGQRRRRRRRRRREPGGQPDEQSRDGEDAGEAAQAQPAAEEEVGTPDEGGAVADATDGDGDGGERRRRGRRGGRRRRRGPDAGATEEAMQVAEEVGAEHPPEPLFPEAPADAPSTQFSGLPAEPEPSRPVFQAYVPPTPAVAETASVDASPAPVETPVAPAAAEPPPVEAAPVLPETSAAAAEVPPLPPAAIAAGEPAPEARAAAPVESAPAAEEPLAGPPRRGWWSRRIFGQ